MILGHWNAIAREDWNNEAIEVAKRGICAALGSKESEIDWIIKPPAKEYGLWTYAYGSVGGKIVATS